MKQAGRNDFRFFTTEMNLRALHWVSLEHQLRGAMAHNELSLYYQPVACLDDGRVCGAEALMRWQPAGMEMISPVDADPFALRPILVRGLTGVQWSWLVKMNSADKARSYGTLAGTADLVPKPITPVPMPITGHGGQPLDWIAQNADGWITYPRGLQRQAEVVAQWRPRWELRRPASSSRSCSRSVWT